MQSFRTELENPLVEKDIIDLEKKIQAFKAGRIPDEKFRSLRLARGIYGQRQPGVQMIRIKLPFGKVSFKQLLRIADVSDEYSTGRLHLTTRQDIQIHYVSLDHTPELWAKLEQDDVTLREACGNTVRNVTASATAGIDPKEPFDVSGYAHAVFAYFLRNPICQEMGRKFKMSFSSSEDDTAFSFIHDLGFIPKVRIIEGVQRRGFKVLFGGGLGAQPAIAHQVDEFLNEDELIPYIEATLRVFDRYGERNNRNKARFKFLIQKLGLEEVQRLIEEERKANQYQIYRIDDEQALPYIPEPARYPLAELKDPFHYERWRVTNVFEQKQQGYFGVYIKVPTGDITTGKVRRLVNAISPWAADEIRITPNQGLLLKYVRFNALPLIYAELLELGLANPGFDSVADVTTCPGTDTCNLGISNSTTLATVLEELIEEEYEDLVYNKDIKIKISGCMNSCGQHGLAHIGFHGSSLKSGDNVIPAVQVLLGGGIEGDGAGRAAQKILKVPSKRATDVLRLVLNDYESKGLKDELFNAYYQRLGKDYFYQLLKPLADLTTITEDDLIDWGHVEAFETAIGVGECAGVMIDLVSTLLLEAEEKLEWAKASFSAGAYSDAIYHAYSVLVNSAKALLLDKGVNSSTQHGVIKDFELHYIQGGILPEVASFSDLVLQINKNEPTKEFAISYLADVSLFTEEIRAYRKQSRKENVLN